jgi:hypothetical protein
VEQAMSELFVFVSALAIAGVTIYGLTRAFPQHPDVELCPHPPDGDGIKGTSTAIATASAARAPAEIHILSRTRVGRGQSLVLVEIEGRRLLLGSTSAQWCALADLGSAPLPADDNPFGPIDAELARAVRASRDRRGWKHS